MKQKIYIPQPIAAAGEDYLIEKGYEIVRGSGKTDKESIKNDIAVCDAMIQRTAKVDKEILDAGKNLKIIARHGAGYDNLDWMDLNLRRARAFVHDDERRLRGRLESNRQ